MCQALGSNFYALFNAGIREPNLAPSQCQGSSTSEMDTPALESRILPIPNVSALGPGFSSSSTISQTGKPRTHTKCGATNHPVSKLAHCEYFFYRFGVLRLRLHRFETIYLEVAASDVGHLNVL